MSEIKLCIFDMDGLLLDSERQMWLANEMKIIEELGYKPDYDLLTTTMGVTRQTFKEGILNHYGNQFPIDKFYEKIAVYNDEMINNNQIDICKGTIELLKFLKENNITSRVATSTAKETAIRMLKNTKLYDYFEKIIYGDEIKNSKPAPDIYLKALEGFDKDEALIFEDSHNGSRAAINAGIKLIIVPNIAKLTKEDKEEAFKVLNSLDETINIIKDINKIK